MIRIKSEKQLRKEFGNFRKNCVYGWSPSMDGMIGETMAAGEILCDRYIFSFRGNMFHLPLDYCEPALNYIPFFEAL